jgi:hypothetical protein
MTLLRGVAHSDCRRQHRIEFSSDSAPDGIGHNGLGADAQTRAVILD